MSRSCPSTPHNQLLVDRQFTQHCSKWPAASNLAQWCTVTCQMMFAKCPASTWFEIFKKFMQKLKLATYLRTIYSPSIVQMASNLAQGCTVTCQMIIAPGHGLPIWFEIFKKKHAKTKIEGCILLSIYQNPFQHHVKHMMV